MEHCICRVASLVLSIFGHCGNIDLERQRQFRHHLHLINSPKIVFLFKDCGETHKRMLDQANLSTSGALPHTPAEGRARCLSRKQNFLSCSVVILLLNGGNNQK